jgi:hypothetical protein
MTPFPLDKICSIPRGPPIENPLLYLRDRIEGGALDLHSIVRCGILCGCKKHMDWEI